MDPETFPTDQLAFYMGALVPSRCKQNDIGILLDFDKAGHIDTLTVQPKLYDGAFGK